jgi:hypothetical protein
MTFVQRRLLGLLTLVGISAFAGAGLYYAAQSERSHSAAQGRAAKLFEFTAATQLTNVNLHAPSGTFVLAREGDVSKGWMIESPLRTPADPDSIDSTLQALVDAQQLGEVTAGAAQPQAADSNTLKMYGLAPPRYHLTLVGNNAAGQQRTETLLVGKKNSFDGSVYAKRGEKGPVVRVPNTVATHLEQDLFKLREKRPAVFTGAQVQKFTVEFLPDGAPGPAKTILMAGGKRAKKLLAPTQAAPEPAQHPRSFTVERSGAGFVVRNVVGGTQNAEGGTSVVAGEPHAAAASAALPGTFAADTEQVETLLGALSGLRAKLFVSEAAADADARRPFGLASPRYRVTLTTAADSDPIVLLLGEVLLPEQAHYFAMREGNNPVIELGSDWAFKKLSVPLAELRDLHLLHLDADAVQAIEIVSPGKSLWLQRDEKKDPADKVAWKMAQARRDTGGEAADGIKVISLLYRLKNLRPQKVLHEEPTAAELTQLGLAPAVQRIAFYGKDAAPLGALKLGTKQGEHLAVQADGTPWVGQVATAVLQDIAGDAAAYRPDPKPPTE